MQLICPHCKNLSNVLRLRTPRNYLIAFLNAAMRNTLGFPELPFAYMCIACRGVFRSASCRQATKNYCVECAYDLTGNVSGRCPECGHSILHQLPPAQTLQGDTQNET